MLLTISKEDGILSMFDEVYPLVFCRAESFGVVLRKPLSIPFEFSDPNTFLII